MAEIAAVSNLGIDHSGAAVPSTSTDSFSPDKPTCASTADTTGTTGKAPSQASPDDHPTVALQLTPRAVPFWACRAGGVLAACLMLAVYIYVTTGHNLDHSAA